MCNNFEQNQENNKLVPLLDLNSEVSVHAMMLEFLASKSNSAKIKNKYANSLKALRLFIETN